MKKKIRIQVVMSIPTTKAQMTKKKTMKKNFKVLTNLYLWYKELVHLSNKIK